MIQSADCKVEQENQVNRNLGIRFMLRIVVFKDLNFQSFKPSKKYLSLYPAGLYLKVLTLNGSFVYISQNGELYQIGIGLEIVYV